MQFKKGKIGSIKKISLTLLLVVTLFFSPLTTPKAHAAIWAMFVEFQYEEMLAEIYDTVQGIIVGVAKQAVVKALNKKVDDMISKGGGSNGAMYITDWKDYLRVKPTQNSNKFINDYISQTLNGRSSSSQYVSAGSEGFGNGGGNYLKQLGEGAKKMTSERKTPQTTYTGDPSQMFADGNFKNMGLYFSGINNPWAYTTHIQDRYIEEKAAQERQATAKSIAGQGFTGKENKEGKTITPGITVKDILSNTKDTANKVIGGANDLPSVISSLVTSIISTALSKGIGNIGSQLDKTNKSTEAKVAACQVNPTDPDCR